MPNIAQQSLEFATKGALHLSQQAQVPATTQTTAPATFKPPSDTVVFSHVLVKVAQENLMQALKGYMDADSLETVLDACVFADQAHIKDRRKSGEPYVTHPMAVAEILANFRMDVDTIIAALLHDTVEDTEVTEADVSSRYGETVCLLVDGVTKLKISSSKQLNTAATFRKILTATLSDARVLIIKLADRLHNLSTMMAVKPEKRIKTAQETLDFYLPFARVLGLNALADELELLCLKNLDERQFDFFNTQLGCRKLAREHRQGQIKNYFYKKLEQLGLSGHVSAKDNRADLFRAFFANKTELGVLLGRYHFTIVLNKVADCDTFANCLINRYNIDKSQIRDHIRKPHAGGLQALYIRYVYDNETLDLTIQTKTMHKVARMGVMVRDNAPEASRAMLQASLKNLNELVDPTCATSTTRALLHYLNQDKVFALTPDGNMCELPLGATVLDFAYAVSSFLGNHAISATLDDTPVKLATKVSSGQRVCIITDPLSAPNAEWLSFLVTTKARKELQDWLKDQAPTEQIQGGKDAFNRALKSCDSSLDQLSESAWQSLLDWQHTQSKDDIYQRIATGALLPQLVVSRLFSTTGSKKSSQYSRLIKDTQGVELHLANCCNPIQGDPILGNLTRTGMVVHRHRCHAMVEVLKKHPQQVVGLTWEDTKPSDSYFGVVLSIQKVVDEDAVSQMILELRKLGAGVNDIFSTDDETFAYIVVEDRNHVAKAIRTLRTLLGYPSVRRLYQFT